MRVFRILFNHIAADGGAGQAAAQAVPANPHPAAVQPAPAISPNPLAPQAPVNVYFQSQPQAQTPFMAAPAQVAAPAAQQPVAVAAPAPAAIPSASETVTIPLSQLQAFTSIQARLAEMEAMQRTQQEQAQQEQARLLAQRGEIENAMNLLRQQSEQTLQTERQKAAQIEADAARYALDGELSRALAAQPLRPHAAEQLTHLWRGQFTAVRENGTFAVRTPTFETPAQFVARMANEPAYAHFFQPSTQGGTATGQTIQAPQTPPAQPPAAPQPRNMGEAVIMHMQNMQKAEGDARANLSLPMGLKATR